MKDELPTPQYSFWPLWLALSIGLIAFGVVVSYGLSVLGLLLLFSAIIGWTWENRTSAQEDEDERNAR